MDNISLAIHGGAGTLLKEFMTPEQEKEYTDALNQSLEAGFAVLENGGPAMEAVVAAVCVMEDSPLFNAGRGSVFTHKGTHEMDAAVMNGENRMAGAVALITGIKNPVLLAKDVMEKSGHVFLAGEGAMNFAASLGYTTEPESYFYDELRYRQWQQVKGTTQVRLDHSGPDDSKFGTVGAVACDVNGNLAAATSTGGMTNKRWGRIGDSPVIGAGTYAHNLTCAVSCTGSGEYFIRGAAAYDVSCLMEFKGWELEKAAHEVIMRRILETGGDGGLIAVDARGNVAMPFNTEGMYRACKRRNGAAPAEKKIMIYKE